MERHLPKDRAADRGVGRLRLVAAVVSAIAVLWLLALTSFSWWALVVATVVAIAARFWIASWSRIEKSPSPDLVLTSDGLELGAARIAWSSVERVELDQDRLLVRVVTKGETNDDPLEIEPPYDGLGLDDLGRVIEDARRSHSDKSR